VLRDAQYELLGRFESFDRFVPGVFAVIRVDTSPERFGQIVILFIARNADHAAGKSS
jgi:hypothetical protein